VVLGVAPGVKLDAAKPDLRIVADIAGQARGRAEARQQADREAHPMAAARSMNEPEEQP
jgi:hypothetical protein